MTGESQMTHKDLEQIYVVELRVPTLFCATKEIRQPIDNPREFEINKGYYIIPPTEEFPITGGYSEFSLVIEILAKGVKKAEDHALKVARAFSSIVSTYGGYPYQSPCLKRLACISVDGRLNMQVNYIYPSNPALVEFNDHAYHGIRQFFQSYSLLEEQKRHSLQSAIHWYAIATRAVDPTVSYVAAWTGLECIGAEINGTVHPNGPKARCTTCKNNPGEGRDRKKAGIQHIIESLKIQNLNTEGFSESLAEDARQSLERDFQGWLTVEQAGDLRGSIVHGLDGNGSSL